MKSRIVRVLAVLLVGAAFLAACSGDSNENESGASGGSESGNAAVPGPATAASPNVRVTSDEFSTAINAVRPATAQIISHAVQFDQLNRPFNIPNGVGSGVIYDSDGYVLTNDHVIAGAESLLVSLPNGRSFEASIVGRDPRTDLAVLKISGSDLPVAELGDSDETAIGDWAVAIGNALGLPGGPTVTVGVVSALGRTVQEPPPSGGGGSGPFLSGMIQTDAAINPGNSGGPLVNIDGEVIGINTLVAGAAAEGIQAQGIGFAISINHAKRIADALEANGRVEHAYLGVSYVALNPAIAAQLGSSETQGAAVLAVDPGSPAAQAGLSRGDIITKVNGNEISGESDLAVQIDSNKPGDTVTLTVSRQGTEREVRVTLGTAPA
jgi:S1-C subfamily serine protease